MKKRTVLAWTSFGLLVTFASCGGGTSGGSSGSSGRMTILESSNGFGQLLPHRIFEADSQGLPTANILEIRSLQTLIENASLSNPILPPVEWPTGATLPDGSAGNHFLFTRFSRKIDLDSVFDLSSGATANDNLRGTITILALDPVTGTSTQIEGRAFVGGFTPDGLDPDNPGRIKLERWIGLEDGVPTPLNVNGAFPGAGFPGTESGGLPPFAGVADLVSPNSFVFIPDADDDLLTYQTFPPGVQIRMRMTSAVESTDGNPLEEEGLASTTVGADGIPPEVAVAGQLQTPVIIPGNGDVDVDPETDIVVEFSEPVQLTTIGELDTGGPPGLSAAIRIQFGPPATTVSVPFTVEPISVFDLSRLKLDPTYNFPGSGAAGGALSCGNFGQIEVVVNPDQFLDLPGNSNTLGPSTFFTTGEGPGLVNAPVCPDVIYIGRGGSNQGLSVIDLNGFGQGTGNPTYDFLNPIQEGNSNFPNNPNVALQGSILTPPLNVGTCTFDGGSAGALTVTKDSSLNDLLATDPILESVGDMALGHSLDNTFNNASPFGCQAGGGNICASTGLKIVAIAAGGANTLAPLGISTFPVKTVVGAENLVSWSPHPNPPPIIFPPLCLSPFIGQLEPTAIDTQTISGLTNLLSPSALPLGNPEAGIPPQGLLSLEQNVFFQGVSPPQPQISLCLPYMMRQQVGQFLYVVDRVAREIVVLNSNRFTVIDRIPVSDPTSLAMSPNLDLLAVTSESTNLVTFIDVDPGSTSFHQVVKNVSVGVGPTGIVWDPGNEDIVVCNTAESTLSIISVFTLEVRKTLRNQIDRPMDLAITPRQFGFGFQRNVWFGYVLNMDGSVAVIESGPDGINGWGFDDVIGTIPFTFTNPRAIIADVTNLNSAVWIAHENQLDANGDPTGLTGGAISNVAFGSGVIGLIPLSSGAFTNPQIRDIQYDIVASIGSDQLTGVPVDLAMDFQRNQTALTNFTTPFSSGTPLSINGKSIVKPSAGGFIPASAPQFLFAAVPNSSQGPGVVDVIDLASGFRRFDTNVFQEGTQSIPAPGCNVLMDFLRQ